MTIKCAVVGQSNTLTLNGFFKALNETENVEIVRTARLGASPSVIGPYYIDDDFFNGCDYCIIDFCVVDMTAISYKKADLLVY
jgi:hypothetical protein